MSPTPDTDDNGTDRPDTEPNTQPGTAASSDDTSEEPETGEAEDGAGLDATEADHAGKAAASSGESDSKGKSESAPLPPRGVLTLRALRWGGVSAIFVSVIVIYLLWPEGARLHWDPRTPRGSVGTTFYLIALAIIATFGWLLGPRQSRHPGRRLAASVALIVMPGLMATAITASKWRHDYQVTGFSQPTLSIISCIPASITITLLANSILHYTQNFIPRNLNIKCDLAYWGHLHQPATSSKASNQKRKPAPLSISTRQRSIYLCTVILPTLLLTGFAAAPILHRPESHTTANPGSIETPSMSTSLSSGAAWDVEFVNIMDIVGGSGGPIVLSADGITSLNPSDGTTRWSYQRPGAQYLSDDIRDEKGKLVISPDRKYVAARMTASAILDYPDEGILSRTVVFDALTGDIILETTGSGGSLQLTDSAILDGNTAYSLSSKSKLWKLERKEDYSSNSGKEYWGPAGHRSFIIDDDYSEYSGDHYLPRTTLTVARDTDPGTTSEVTGVMTDSILRENNILVTNGWIARYSSESAHSSGGALAEAISLDSAVHESDVSTPVPLGSTSGLNSYASLASGCIVTYPPSEATSSNEFELIIKKEGAERISSVFDPTTRTTSEPAHYSGIAAARIGFIPMVHEGHPTASISIQPADNSPQTSIPLALSTTYSPSISYLSGPNRQPHEMFADEFRFADEIIVNTPGAAVIALNVTAGSQDASYLDPKPIAGSTFRVFGVTGK